MTTDDCDHGEKMFVTDNETGEKKCIVCDVDRSFTLDEGRDAESTNDNES